MRQGVPLAFDQLVAIDEHADHEANVRRLAAAAASPLS